MSRQVGVHPQVEQATYVCWICYAKESNSRHHRSAWRGKARYGSRHLCSLSIAGMMGKRRLAVFTHKLEELDIVRIFPPLFPFIGICRRD